MTVLLETTLPRTLDALVTRFAQSEWAGARLEAWLFEDLPARRRAEAKLAKAGITARLRSAYKPLLHAFLEDGLSEGEIQLPSHPAAVPGRFALEAYPLAGLMQPRPIFTQGTLPLDYPLADGTRIFAPNRVSPDSRGDPALSVCGWLRVWQNGVAILDEHLPTEFELAHAAVLDTVRAHPWPETTPYFQTLHIEIATTGIQHRLDLAHECIDTAEALHEELYFGLLELFQSRAGQPPGKRRFQPGQIVPEIRRHDGPTTIRISLVPHLAETAPLGPEPLETARRALDPVEISEIFATFAGTPFTAISVQGRTVAGLHVPGTHPGLVVTAGQHANETSAVIGLLRAAPSLFAEPEANLALVALENPDGYALHRRLCATHPHHMHHAARYTALGDDLEARQTVPLFETAARLEAIARTDARLHISLHGYPAQEWTRPLSGYVPGGFGSWTLPCGYFLILRHHPGLEATGLAFLEALTAELATDAALVAMNRAQLALRSAHGGPADELVLHDIPCRITVNTRSTVPFTLITEYPDETITGPDFTQAHTVQRDTVLAAARLLWAGKLAS